MPLIRLSLRAGKPQAHIDAIVEGTYQALRATFDVPEHDRFAVVHELDAGRMQIDHTFMVEAPRSDDAVVIELTVSNTRTTEKKQALYRAIADNLARDPGLRGEDVFVILVEVQRENWSFGGGIAQYVAS